MTACIISTWTRPFVAAASCRRSAAGSRRHLDCSRRPAGSVAKWHTEAPLL